MPNYNQKGKKNPNYKDGRSLKKYYCIDCNKKLVNYITKYNRCKYCTYKFIKNNTKNPIKYCKDCNVQLSNTSRFLKKVIRCISCSKKFLYRNPKNHPSYIDGRNDSNYPKEFNEKLKEEIRSRDNYECKNCSMTDEEHILSWNSSIEVHHIDYHKDNCSLENLITLCKQCNVRANYNRDYWQEFYTEKQHEKNTKYKKSSD